MKSKTRIITSTALVSALAISSQVMAAGVEANSLVTNSISIGYEANGNTISLPGAASDSFIVDEKVEFSLVAEDNPTTVVVYPAQGPVTLTYSLTNDGNSARDFDIDLLVAGGAAALGLTYDPTGSGAPGTFSVYTNPLATGGTDTLYDPTNIVGVGSLDPDERIYIKVVAYIAPTALQGQLDNFTMTATALNAAGDAAEPGSTTFGPMALDVRYGAPIDNATESFLVNSALVAATKSVVVVSENRTGGFNCAIDPAVGGDAFIPGACVSYTITLSNDATAGIPATNFTFTDNIPANLTFRALEPGHTFDNVVVGTGVVSGTVNSLAPGATATLSFRATID